MIVQSAGSIYRYVPLFDALEQSRIGALYFECSFYCVMADIHFVTDQRRRSLETLKSGRRYASPDGDHHQADGIYNYLPLG
ncbi:MAG: hypothetical protein WAQ52_07835 [Terriglobales bacterium]